MFVYTVSLITSYNPFLELEYFSPQDFEIGEVLEVNFSKKKVKACIIKKENLNSVKQKLRSASFSLQKIPNQKKENIFLLPNFIFEDIQNFAQKFGISFGEVFYNLFGDDFKSIFQNFEFKNNLEKALFAKSFYKKVSFSEKQNFYKNLFSEKEGQTTIIISTYEISFLVLKDFAKKFLKENKNFFIKKPTDALEFLKQNQGIKNLKVIFDETFFAGFTLIQKPHINQLFAILLFLKWQKNLPEIIFLSDTFGLAESYFFEQNNILEYQESHNFEEFLPAKKSFFTLQKSSPEYKTLKKDLIQEPVLEKIKQTLQNSGKVFVFVLSHGYSQRIYCKSCNSPYSCFHCKKPYKLNVLESGGILFCQDCKKERKLDPSQVLLCTVCGGFNFEEWGFGIQKVADFLQEKLETEILCLDEQNKKFTDINLVKKVKTFFENNSGGVVVGGIRSLRSIPSSCDISVAISFGDLNSNNYDAVEKSIKLLSAIESKTKSFIVQRILDEDSKNFYESFLQKNFFEEELQKRKLENKPPFCLVLTITFPSKNLKQALLFSKILEKDGEYVKNKNLVYYYFIFPEKVESLKNLIQQARIFSDVCLSFEIKEFTSFKN